MAKHKNYVPLVDEYAPVKSRVFPAHRQGATLNNSDTRSKLSTTQLGVLIMELSQELTHEYSFDARLVLNADYRLLSNEYKQRSDKADSSYQVEDWCMNERKDRSQ